MKKYPEPSPRLQSQKKPGIIENSHFSALPAELYEYFYSQKDSNLRPLHYKLEVTDLYATAMSVKETGERTAAVFFISSEVTAAFTTRQVI
jgi:hypothetical protein